MKNAVRLIASIAVAALVVVLGWAPASATTGAGAGLPAPKTHVDPGVMGPYVGLFELTHVERRARIITSEIAIDYTELPPAYPIGRIVVRSYDADGRQATFQGTLYSFTGEKDVHADILSQGDNSVVGGLTLRDPTADSVKGTLEFQGQSFEVAYRRYDDDDGRPEETRVIQTGPSFVSATKTGWGKDPADAIGDYDLVNGVADPGAGAGVFAPAVRYARSLTGASGAPTDGSLTVEDDGGTLTGELKVDRPEGAQTYALTDLKWGGSSRSAVVHQGDASGPEVGTLKGVLANGELDLTLTVDGKKTDLVLRQTQG